MSLRRFCEKIKTKTASIAHMSKIYYLAGDVLMLSLFHGNKSQVATDNSELLNSMNKFLHNVHEVNNVKLLLD